MKRLALKLGDLFEVETSHGKRIFKYIADDLTQLNSEVIKIFKLNYAQTDDLSLDYAVTDQVDFYAHTNIKLGVKLRIWKKIGNTSNVGSHSEILFKIMDNDEYRAGSDNKWYVWSIGEQMQYVGGLKGENGKAHLGLIFTPDFIKQKIISGKYPGVFGKY
ncbi:MAG: hypothetical protein EOP51_09225 [Sphingobacteriales bacterium]|nr:MAG: hypothetical protein EOP51_09225 [Sphingobacteriales bacterium]